MSSSQDIFPLRCTIFQPLRHSVSALFLFFSLAKAVDNAWAAEPPTRVTVDFGRGVSRDFTFQNAIYGKRRGQMCLVPGCREPHIKVPGNQHATQHSKKYHVPQDAVNEEKKKTPLDHEELHV